MHTVDKYFGDEDHDHVEPMEVTAVLILILAYIYLAHLNVSERGINILQVTLKNLIKCK